MPNEHITTALAEAMTRALEVTASIVSRLSRTFDLLGAVSWSRERSISTAASIKQVYYACQGATSALRAFAGYLAELLTAQGTLSNLLANTSGTLVLVAHEGEVSETKEASGEVSEVLT